MRSEFLRRIGYPGPRYSISRSGSSRTTRIAIANDGPCAPVASRGQLRQAITSPVDSRGSFTSGRCIQVFDPREEATRVLFGVLGGDEDVAPVAQTIDEVRLQASLVTMGEKDQRETDARLFTRQRIGAMEQRGHAFASVGRERPRDRFRKELRAALALRPPGGRTDLLVTH